MVIALLFGLVLLPSAPVQSLHAEPPPLNELLSSDEYARYQSRPVYKHRIDVFRKALDRHASVLRRNFKGKKIDRILTTMLQMRTLSRLALEEPSRASASAKDQRAREIKKMEIRVRRLLQTLDDLKVQLPFEYLPELQATVNDLEALRDQLLGQIFGRSA